MARQETIDRIITYAKKLPDVDSEMLRVGLPLFHLHCEIEMLIETYVIKRHGISMRQVDTLEALFHKQDKTLTPAQLAEEILLTRSAMTSNLDSLERKGYLSRATHPDDRRRLIISLTRKGAELCDKIMPLRYRDMIRVMECLPSEMRDTLHIIYSKLIECIGNILKEVND